MDDENWHVYRIIFLSHRRRSSVCVGIYTPRHTASTV